mgnify:CR=1 FL=1
MMNQCYFFQIIKIFDMKKYKILGLTLARGGSQGIKNKNIKLLKGKPLIYYTIIEALKSKLIDRYVVSTDSKKIQNISLKYGAESPFLRPKNLSSSKATSASAIKHAIEWVENEEGYKYDYIIELMCTNPLKKSIDIDASIKKLIRTKADSVIAVHKLEDHHPARIKKIINDKIVNFCVDETLEMRRQDLKPHAYIRSGSIYALKRDYFMKNIKRYGSLNSRPYILPPERVINIDDINDFYLAENLMK